MVEQDISIAGARSLNEEELKKNLEFFKAPNANMESIRSKLAMKICDEYANILKGMYSIYFTEDPTTGTHQLTQLWGPRLLL